MTALVVGIGEDVSMGLVGREGVGGGVPVYYGASQVVVLLLST